jgi:tight adherence protein B
MPIVLLIALVFAFGAAVVVGLAALAVYLPGALAERRLARRLDDVSTPADIPADGEALVMRPGDGPFAAMDRFAARTSAGSWLGRVIDQSGRHISPGAVVAMSAACAAAAALVAHMFVPQGPMQLVPILAGAVAAAGPITFLLHRRTLRMRKFEEEFPEALDLLSRALRAGHALQTALGMVADELREPVGPEFKKTFDQQNFGLPLRDALHQMTERVPILDVRFFVTAVLIQRETGGNLSEILDNLAHVVRERFKIRRQVRVHTAHGRFTAFVLLSLPAGLAIALSVISPDQMHPLFHERMGQMLLLAAMVLQTIGFVWIRQVIKIEV